MRLPCAILTKTARRVSFLKPIHTAMELTDLTGNGAKDLLLITSDTSGKRVARLYQYDNGSMLPAGGDGDQSGDSCG